MINFIRNLKNTKTFLLVAALVSFLAVIIAVLEGFNTLFDFWGNFSVILSEQEYIFLIEKVAIVAIAVITIIILAITVYKQRHKPEYGVLDESIKNNTLTIYIDNQKYEFTLFDIKPVDGNGEGGSFIDLSFKCEDTVHKCWYTLCFYINEDLRVGKKCTNDYEQFSISRWTFDGTKNIEQRYELFDELNCSYFLKLTYRSNFLRRYQGTLNAKAYSVSAYERAFHHNAFFDKKYYAEIKSHKENSTGNERCKFDFTLPYDSNSLDSEEEESGHIFDEAF